MAEGKARVQVLHEERVGPHSLRIWRDGKGVIRSRMFIAPVRPGDWAILVDTTMSEDFVPLEVETFRDLVRLAEGR